MEYFAAGLRVVGQTADGGRNGEVWMKSFLLRYFDRLTLRAARQTRASAEPFFHVASMSRLLSFISSHFQVFPTIARNSARHGRDMETSLPARVRRSSMGVFQLSIGVLAT